MVAELSPKPDVAPTIRKLPAPVAATPMLVEHATVSVEGAVAEGVPVTPDGPAPLRSLERRSPRVAPAVTRPPVVAPLAPERFKVQFTIGRETHEAPARAGFDAPRRPEWRSRRNRRPCADATCRALGADEAGEREAAGLATSQECTFAAHPVRREARSLGARRRPLCVRRNSRTLRRANSRWPSSRCEVGRRSY
jgi:hypothetical protein